MQASDQSSFRRMPSRHRTPSASWAYRECGTPAGVVRYLRSRLWLRSACRGARPGGRGGRPPLCAQVTPRVRWRGGHSSPGRGALPVWRRDDVEQRMVVVALQASASEVIENPDEPCRLSGRSKEAPDHRVAEVREARPGSQWRREGKGPPGPCTQLRPFPHPPQHQPCRADTPP